MRNRFGQQGGRKAHDGMFGRERLKHVLNAQVFLTSVPVLACVSLPAVLQAPSASQISKRQRLKVKINNPVSIQKPFGVFCSLKHLPCLSLALNWEGKFRPLSYPNFIQICKFTGKLKQEF